MRTEEILNAFWIKLRVGIINYGVRKLNWQTKGQNYHTQLKVANEYLIRATASQIERIKSVIKRDSNFWEWEIDCIEQGAHDWGW